MKKNILLTIATTLAVLPTLAGAQGTVQVHSTGQATEAQVFTACSQAAIEMRDSTIGSARTAYNNTMALALDARKEAEKEAVAMTDQGDKKEAIKKAVDSYKKAVTQAQETLVKARKEAWSSFETNTKNCRDISKGKQVTNSANVQEMRSMIQATGTEAGDTQPVDDHKTIKESFLESIKNLFKRGTDSSN